MHRILLLAGFIAGTACTAQAQDTPPTQPVDWKARLEADVTAFHAAIMDSHPGPVDPLNLAFRPRAEAGLKQALERAKTVHTPGGWWWALRAYQAAFDDGHVQLYGIGDGAKLNSTWPGFLTVWTGADQVVAARQEGRTDTPPVGAKLISCDGTKAGLLAEQRVGAFRGRWFLESQRVTYGDLLFVNTDNPYLSPLKACRFATKAGPKTYRLTWTQISNEDLGKYLKLTRPARDYRFGLRENEGTLWLSTPGFNGNTQSDDYRELTTLIAALKAEPARLNRVGRVVLDLRGNGGGSSQWGYEIARQIWGGEWMAAHEARGADAVDWRPSEANIATIAAFVADQKANSGSVEAIQWGERALAGMKAARDKGEAYWHDANEGDASQGPAGPQAPLFKGRVFVLTDTSCGSACLDAVDLWKALGAVQVGRETSADTLYMEVRNQTLPSGMAGIGVPMKVYRGRPRGNNEPQRPTHVFEGDMSDDAALLTWIKGL
ncbi:S41 family peptidase [Asticcacaulis sp.]|uniref:S41 family peptidase n=1 Tax=Asticcacaulis sp. TaxID=1872648 RepID=UPI00262983C3|nr:S41 family peptidase [Asticcacaulis sp.]